MTNFRTDVAYDIRVSDGNVVDVGAATRDTSYFSCYHFLHTQIYSSSHKQTNLWEYVGRSPRHVEQ